MEKFYILKWFLLIGTSAPRIYQPLQVKLAAWGYNKKVFLKDNMFAVCPQKRISWFF